MGKTPALIDLGLTELTAVVAELGEPRYRARQLFAAIHRRHVEGWGELTDLPAALRRRLAAEYRLSSLQTREARRSVDGTVKLLLSAADGQSIEAVGIPALARKNDRLTVCVSSQAGCPLACGFCATGQMGFARNLAVGEIVEQVYRVERSAGRSRVDNVVFMGMGEPLLNYERVVEAIRLLAQPEGYGCSPRRVTVSTSGLAPEMRRLADEGLGVRLALSLHAPDDGLRSELMPINRRYPVAQVLSAAAYFAERTGRRVSYEYVMLDGVNDSERQAQALARLLVGRGAHVNLIPYNQTHSGFRSSPPARVRAFGRVLREAGIACSIRASRGEDIAAACGQLKVEAIRPSAGDSAGALERAVGPAAPRTQ